MSQDTPAPEAAASRPQPFFVADAPGLDFLNSYATPFGEKIEWISNGEDLIAWLKAANLITDAIAEEVRSHALPGELDSVATAARALREWFRGLVLAHKGKPLSVRVLNDLAPLNDLLSRDESYLSICPRAHVRKRDRDEAPSPVLESIRTRRWRTPSSLLLPVAEKMAELVSSADFTQVKKCESEKCGIVLYDTTQRHARRWCSMAICGNRAKQAAHRNRVKRQDRADK